jgi:hypothetical protein
MGEWEGDGEGGWEEVLRARAAACHDRKVPRTTRFIMWNKDTQYTACSRYTIYSS